MAAGTNVATPSPTAAKPATVPGTLGKASAAPIPTAMSSPPARARVRSPKRSTSRSPVSRPTNMQTINARYPVTATAPGAPTSSRMYRVAQLLPASSITAPAVAIPISAASAA